MLIFAWEKIMIKRECDYIEAARNVEGFDIRELEYVELIELFKNRLGSVLKRMSSECVLNTDNLKFVGIDYDCEKEADKKFYVTIYMTFELQNSIYNKLSLKLTPFTAKLVDKRNKYWCGEQADKELTKCWQEFMSGRYGKKWENAFLRSQYQERKVQQKFGELTTAIPCEMLGL